LFCKCSPSFCHRSSKIANGLRQELFGYVALWNWC
jgi:hypothetical protein